MNWQLHRMALVVVTAAASSAWCATGHSGFSSGQRGFFMGGGGLFAPLRFENRYDPVPDLAPEGSTVRNTRGSYLVPAKMGFFWGRSRFELQAYGRILLNTVATWTAMAPEGSGRSTFRSYGAGGNALFFVLDCPRIRIGIVGNAEMILHRLRVGFRPEGELEQTLDLSATGLVAGSGISTQLWLGDHWALEALGLYQYGFDSSWSAARAATFLGSDHAAGLIRNPRNGAAVPAEFGGFLVELALRLAF